jgi:two-component system NtrC family sensor kinase
MGSGVAHEINNPLAAIMGYSELLIDEESVSENGRGMLERMISCVERCRKIVQGLLSFARKTELEKKPTNINDIIDKVLEHREYDLTVSNIEVVKAFEIEEPVAVVDPNQMEQVFLNLVNNAFDSMSGRDVPGILEIRTFQVNDETMQIEFIDNGQGIKDGDKERLFEPFFTTKEIGKGTGLGLSVSYGIIKEHDGDLYLDDAHYCGAKFVITLPVVFDRQSFNEPDRRVKSSAWPKTHGKVLVVDDEEVVADVIDAALSVKGYSVECASTGEEAYQMIDSGVYDLVISDIRMPGSMDGRRLYYEVREQDPELAERFIFISGDVMEKTTAEFLNECGRAYLLKPFSLIDLREVIEKALNQPHS